MTFSDRIDDSTSSKNSALIAGFDPLLDAIPTVFLTEASSAQTEEDYLYRVLFGFHRFVLESAESYIAAVKPNIAFFEQYGLGGLKALQDILLLCQDLKLPSVLDVKRGDIGSSAESYARAYLTGVTVRGKKSIAFEADAITVNPFLGFDTLEVFAEACAQSSKGMFILVKTSNPGSSDLQDMVGSNGRTVSEKIAQWIAEKSYMLKGTCGISGLGAVVGATHPTELVALRQLMPDSLFLIPGLGAQGGKTTDVIGGFSSPHKGALINVSRGLLTFAKKESSKDDLRRELVERSKNFTDSLKAATAKQFKIDL